MNWRVVDVKPLDDYVLELTFITGEVKHCDVKPLLNEGVFKTLQNKEYFKLVKPLHSSVAWPNEVDIAPETLYEDGIIVEGQLKE